MPKLATHTLLHTFDISRLSDQINLKLIQRPITINQSSQRNHILKTDTHKCVSPTPFKISTVRCTYFERFFFRIPSVSQNSIKPSHLFYTTSFTDTTDAQRSNSNITRTNPNQHHQHTTDTPREISFSRLLESCSLLHPTEFSR